MSARFVDRVIVTLKLHRVATLVGALTALGVLVTALLIVRASDETSTSVPTTSPSLASLFCARASDLASFATTLDDESWRTAPLGLEESFRSWASDPEKASYLPDDVFAFARDECFLAPERVTELQPRTLYEQAVDYAYNTLLPTHLATTNAALATPTDTPVLVLEQALLDAATASSFPDDVSLRVFGRVAGALAGAERRLHRVHESGTRAPVGHRTFHHGGAVRPRAVQGGRVCAYHLDPASTAGALTKIS